MKIGDVFKPKNRGLLFAGVAIVGGVVIFSLMRGGGQSAPVQTGALGPSENLQLANLQASTALAQTQMQTQAELSALQFQGQLQGALATQAVQGELALAGIDAQNQTNALAAQLAGLDAQLMTQRELAATEAQTRREETEANRQIQIEALASNQAMFNTSVLASLETSRMQNETIQYQTASQTYLWETQIAADALNAQYDRDVDLARINSDLQLGLDEGITTRQGQSQANKTARRGQTLGFVGSVIGGIASIFSDVRVKDDIRQIGETPGGLPLYTYKVDGIEQVGVMAQELVWQNPDAIVWDAAYMQVDYGRVA
jgi:hypothetical protein